MRASHSPLRTFLWFVLSLTAWLAAGRAAGAEARWRQLPLFGGPVASIAAAPSDPRVVYAVPYGGGLFRSDDGGDTWASPSAAASIRGYGRVTVSPADPQEVAMTSTNLPVPHFGRSHDGGTTWERVTVGPPTEVGGVIEVVYDPADPARLYARTYSGLFLSTDDGRSWRRLAFAGSWVSRLYVDPQVPTRLLALVYLPQGGTALLASGDRGATWIERISSAFLGGFLTFAVDPVHAGTIYLTDGVGLLVSEDDGVTWHETARNLTGLTDLATTPSGALLAASYYGVERSTNRGETFGRLRAGDSINRLAVASDGTVYAAADSGIWRSTTDGATWSRSHQGVAAQYVLGLAASGGAQPTLLAAGKGLFRSTAEGASWSRVPNSSGIGYFNPYFPPYQLTFSPTDPKLAFAVLDGGVFRSPDSGVTWRQISPLRGYSLGRVESPRFAFAFDPRDPLTIYFFAGFKGPLDSPNRRFSFYSDDGGATWNRRFRAPEITSVAIDPHRTSTLVGTTAKGLLRSDDRGLHWRPIAPEIGKPTTVAFDPQGMLYVGTEQAGVWASRDGGTMFRPFGRGLDGARIALLHADPSRPGRLFATVARRGVFLWDGETPGWRKLALDFPTAALEEGLIALDPSGEGALYAATWGRGVYRLDLGGL